MNIYRKVGSGISFAMGKPILDIFCRDEDNARHTIKLSGLPIYFYVNEDEEFEQEDMKSVIKITHGYKSLYGKPLKKVFVRKISEARRLGKVYSGFESDLKWDKKCLLDLKLTDMFVEENSKVYTLDARFNALHDQELEGGETTIIASTFEKDLIVSALDKLSELQTKVPTIGKTSFEVRHCNFDIEVIVNNKEQLRTKEGKIMCVVMYDSYTSEYMAFVNEGSERTMLIKVFEYFKRKDFDVITGWNVQFDMGWLLSKANDYDLDLSLYFLGGKTMVSKYTDSNGKFRETFYIGGRSLVDSMELYKKKTMTTEKLASYSLKAVNIVEGGEEYEDYGSRVKEMWEKDPEIVLDYCKKDVEATEYINQKKDLIGGAHTICKFYGCSFNEVITNSLVIESMTFLVRGDRILPNIVRGRDKADIVGAKVLKTMAGLHKNVAIMDAASLYPSIIQGLNISPECLITEQERSINNFVTVELADRSIYMSKKNVKLGLMTEVIIEMRKLREIIRNKRTQATKDGDTEAFALANNEEKVAKGVLASVYGVMGFSEFRLFNSDCANMITAVARGMIQELLDKMDIPGCEIIYGDTDSVFVKLPNVETGWNVVDQMNEINYEYIKRLGVDERVIQMNYEKFFRWIMFNKRASPKLKSKLYKKDKGAAKKKYIGFISHVESGPREMKEVNDMYYKGFELRRSDSAPVLKIVMRRFFELMVDGEYQKSIAYLREIKKEFPMYDKDFIAMPRSVNVFDANDPWANGMRYSKEHLGFEFADDTMPKLLYVKPNYKLSKTDVICYQAGHIIPDSFEVDYNVMYDKLIKKKFEPIIESLGLFWDTAINNQSTLDVFA